MFTRLTVFVLVLLGCTTQKTHSFDPFSEKEWPGEKAVTTERMENLVIELAIFHDIAFFRMLHTHADTNILNYWEAVVYDLHLLFQTLPNLRTSFRVTSLKFYLGDYHQGEPRDCKYHDDIFASRNEIQEAYRNFHTWAYKQIEEIPSFDIAILALGPYYSGINFVKNKPLLGSICRATNDSEKKWKAAAALSFQILQSPFQSPAEILAKQIAIILGAHGDYDAESAKTCSSHLVQDESCCIMGPNKFPLPKHFSNCTDTQITQKLTQLISRNQFCLNTATAHKDIIIDSGKLFENPYLVKSISPIIAELAMQKLENTIIRDNPLFHFYKRFVDDSLAAIPESTATSVLTTLNSYHEDIQFTFELEMNRKIAFLDIEITRQDDGKLKKKVYRKPTHTGRYLNFNSYHHISQKMSVVDSLSFRALVICDQEYIEEELDLIRDDLRSNGYPLGFINSRIEKMRIKVLHYNPELDIAALEDKPIRLILPYMGPLTTRLTHFFSFHVECEFGYIPGMKLGSMLCNMKERLAQLPPGIYKITCSCGITYIGETSRPWKERIDDHFRKSSQSAVTEHMKEFPTHTITIDSASLIEVEHRYFHREAKEGLYIQNVDPEKRMNKNNGKTLNPIISTFLQKLIP